MSNSSSWAESSFLPPCRAISTEKVSPFFPKTLLQMTEIKGLDQMLKDSVELKYAPKELTKAQVADLIQTSIAK